MFFYKKQKEDALSKEKRTTDLLKEELKHKRELLLKTTLKLNVKEKRDAR